MNVYVRASIVTVGQSTWDRLSSAAFPFASYHFLEALETTDCLGDRTGWYPRYLVVEREGHVLGVMITFARVNSWGEYVFDFAWAEGARHAGLRYYPKLTTAIPFTPATGPKLLIDPNLAAAERAEVARRLRAAVLDLMTSTDASSVHALFLPPDEVAAWREDGYLTREGYQFHWANHGFANFTDFLGTLKSKRRREILRERRKVAAAGVTVRRLTGTQLTPAWAEQFYAFYLTTIDKRAGFPYFTPEFFARVFDVFAERILLVVAEDRGGRPVAGALNYFDGEALYGRHWGGVGDFHSLHFECCYYQGLEFAIERGLARFEAGAQGEHKLQRGFLPTLTHSAHRIRDPELSGAIETFVTEESAYVRAEILALGAQSPFADGQVPRGRSSGILPRGGVEK